MNTPTGKYTRRTLAALIIITALIGTVAAHEAGSDAYVRVVQGDPENRTYTFSCGMSPDNAYDRDWFIRPDYGDLNVDVPNEAEILDLPSGEHLTYTFEEEAFYHIGCLIWNPTNGELYRGDLHIDLRQAPGTWDPEIVPVSGSGTTATLRCETSEEASTPWWEVVDAQTGTVTNLGEGDTITHTVEGHGLHDYICHVGSEATGYPVEYFDQGDPYFPDAQGVPHGITNTRDGTSTSTYEAVEPVPTLSLSVTGNTTAGWTLHTVTTDFTFYEPEGDMAPHVDGEGHVHWYLDGAKQGRLYEEDSFIGALPAGEHAIRVVLSTNDHKEYVVDGEPIQDEISLLVEEETQEENTTAHTSVETIPATCTGGSITRDEDGNGRDITCQGSTGTLRIQAWDKPDEGTPTYFEMYKKEQSGTGIRICLADTCIEDNGYAKSQEYPITTQQEENNTQQNDTQPPEDHDNTTEQNTTTHTSVETIPATCTGGSITRDEWTGGRIIRCEGAQGFILATAYDKPDEGTPTHFEMYRSDYEGSGIRVCLADTCIEDNGYAKSQEYPITTQQEENNTQQNDTQPPEDHDNTTEQNTTAHTSVETIPATCTGGSITRDEDGNGRDITCQGSTGTLRIQAWDKPDEGTPTYFEMYKKEQSGTGIRICLADTCIEDNGYAKSQEYPITTQQEEEPTGDLGPIRWYGHTGNTGVAPNYFHLEVLEPSGTSIHESSDWEVWTEGMEERVWAAERQTGALRYHVHTPDGSFLGGLENETMLDYGTTYQARVRFRGTGGSVSEWSSLYEFTTLAPVIEENNTRQWTAAEGFKVEEFATGLDYPVHVAAAPKGLYEDLPDNEEPYLYVTELYGKIKTIHKDGSVSTYAEGLINFDPFGSITGGGQMGVIGLYVAPTGDLYAGMTYVENGTEVKNKVVRFTTSEDGNTAVGSTTIIQGLPSSASHQVEQITRGPDGKLYVNVGDALLASNAQSDTVLAGRILRMEDDGSGLETYAKGFRNPFGADWNPTTGVLYVTDNAPDSEDRIVRVLPGENYGWGLNDDFATWNERSLFHTDVSPVDIEFNPGASGFPEELDGRMYVAVAGPVYTKGQTESKHVLEFVLDSQGGISSHRELVKYTGNGYGTPMGLDFAPDGLYFTDLYGEEGASGYGSEGRVLRVVPGTPADEGTGGEPRTNIYVSPWYPKLEGETITYQFTCHPIDGEGPFVFDWDLGDGSKLYGDTYSEEGDGKKMHTYPYEDRDYTVSCTAHDQGTGAALSASMTINPSNYLPE